MYPIDTDLEPRFLKWWMLTPAFTRFAAAEETRLRLLALCAHGELTVSELVQILGQSQPRVSRHLKLLCDVGLLEKFREQHWIYYRVLVETGL